MKKKFFLIVFLFLGLIAPRYVFASSVYVSGGQYVRFSNYGISSGVSHIRTSYKTASNGSLAYCVRITKDFSDGTYTSCNVTSNYKLIVAGQIVDLINAKNWDNNKKYAYKVAALNKALGLSGSGNFSGGTDLTINAIVTEAQRNANKFDTTNEKEFNSLKHSLSSATMNKLGSSNKKTFISKKVSFTGLKKKVLGATPTYSFSVSGLKAGQTAYLCTGASGTGCTTVDNVAKISGVESKDYYVKVTGVDATEGSLRFSIKIKGEVEISYPYGETYCKSELQTLLITKTKKVKYTDSHTVNFKINKIVNNVHQVEILKVDTDGEPIANAEFRYDGPLNNMVGEISEDKTKFTYTYGPVEASQDKFFDQELCFIETTAPNGYVLSSKEEERRSCYPVSGNSVSCYNTSNDESVDTGDLNYCDSNIKYICKKTIVNYKDETVEPSSGDSGGTVDTGETGTGETGTGETGTTSRVLDESTREIVYDEFNDECVSSDDQSTSRIDVEKVCGTLENGVFSSKDEKYCTNPSAYEKVEIDNGNIFIVRTNERNSISISKTDITGDNEVAGAKLKICTENSYNSAENKTDCTPAKTVKDVELSWTSGTSTRTFTGIKKGTYYIIETLPPAGYKIVSTATKFSIDEYGKIKTEGTVSSDGTIVIKNQLNSVTISKTDIATSKELPGAKIAICEVEKRFDEYDDSSLADGNDKDESSVRTDVPEEDDKSIVDVDGTKVKLDLDTNGECIPARLSDGTEATWTSTDKPKVISGLPVGTYYLVEKAAPNGYSTSEAILFKMNEDGTLSDKDGKSLADNKIVMKDAPVKDVKTGMLPILLTSIVALSSFAVLYYYNNLKKAKKI